MSAGFCLGLVSSLWAKDPFPRRLFYYIPADGAAQSFQANWKKVSVFAPQSFVVNADGEVRGEVSPEVLALAHRERIPVMPLVVNEGFQSEVVVAVITTKEKRQRVIEQLLRAAVSGDFFGIQFDFEQVPVSHVKEYTKFVEEAAKAFHRRKLQFSVAVPPRIAVGPASPHNSAATPGGAFPLALQGYNLREIARAVDFLTLMAYEGGPRSQPLPIAGLRWVEATLREALKYVPASKLLLGIPFYGRHWVGERVSDLTHAEAMVLKESSGAEERWDPQDESPWFEFHRDGTHHVVWFENRKSLAAKLRLLERYRLGGFAGWRLGQEDVGFWEGLTVIR